VKGIVKIFFLLVPLTGVRLNVNWVFNVFKKVAMIYSVYT